MSHFWATAAGPSITDVLRFWDRAPRHLRSCELQQPLFLEEIEILHTPAEVAAAIPQIAEFWRREYCGTDWHFSGTATQLAASLLQTDVIIVVARDPWTREVAATVISRDLGAACIGGCEFNSIRSLEGLCVSSDRRSKGLAGRMIAMADYVTETWLGPTVHIWMREVAAANGIDSWTAVRCEEYLYYVSCGQTNTVIINRIQPKAVPNDGLYIRIADATVCMFEIDGAQVAVVNTLRSTVAKIPIWEVLYTTRPVTAQSLSALAEHISVAEGSQIILFTTADTVVDTVTGWTEGLSGAVATYVYNWMPPKFWNLNCCVLWNSV